MKFYLIAAPICFLAAVVAAYMHVNEGILVFSAIGLALSYASLGAYDDVVEELEFSTEQMRTHRCRPKVVRRDEPDLRKKGRVETTITETRYEP